MRTLLRKYAPALGVVLALYLSWLLYKILPAPWPWPVRLLCYGVACALLAVQFKRDTLKYICLTSMSLLLVFAVVEWWYHPSPQKAAALAVRFASSQEILALPNAADTIAYGKNHQPDPVLGYGPAPRATRSRSIKLLGDTVVYDVTYSTLDSGWRVTPQHPKARKAVVFFGCSFTIGEGLNDAETFPWMLGQALGPDWQVFNFGFHGYGAHQLLAHVQSGILDAIAARYEEVTVFYTTISGHELRAGGYSFWDQQGPWYALESGNIVRKGIFSDRQAQARPWYLRAMYPFRETALYRKLDAPRQADTPALAALHVALIAETAKLVREKYGVPMHVLLWPEAEGVYAAGLEALGVSGIPLVKELPGLLADAPKYRIPHDGHPNAQASALMADFLRRRFFAGE